MESMFTMAAVKNLHLKEQFSLDAVGRCHEANNFHCFNVFIQKNDNLPQATIDLVIESMGWPIRFLHHTELSEAQCSPSERVGSIVLLQGAAWQHPLQVAYTCR